MDRLSFGDANTIKLSLVDSPYWTFIVVAPYIPITANVFWVPDPLELYTVDPTANLHL